MRRNPAHRLAPACCTDVRDGVTVRRETRAALTCYPPIVCWRGRDMAMGRLSDRGKVAWSGNPLAVALAPRHYFYDRCNEVLAEAEFDGERREVGGQAALAKSATGL